MKAQLVDSSLLYLVTLKQHLLRVSLAWVLILPWQTFLLIIMSIQSVLSPSSPLTLTLQSISQKLTTVPLTLFFLIFQSSACLLLLLTFSIFILLKKPIKQLDRRAHLLNKLVAFDSVLVMGMEISLFSAVAAVRQVLLAYFGVAGRARPEEMALVLTCSLGIFVTAVINYRIRIMGGLFALYLGLEGFSTGLGLVNPLIGILFCIFLIYHDEDHTFLIFKDRNLRKILHLVLISFFIWKFINAIESGDSVGYLNYLYLLMFMLLAIAIGLTKFICKVNRRLPPVIQLCQCLQILNENPEDIHCKLLALEISQLYQKQIPKNPLLQTENITETHILNDQTMKNICNWDSEEWQKMVQAMTKTQYGRYPSPQSGINMIKCRLMIRDKKLFEILQLLRDLICKYGGQGLTSRYEMLKIALKVQQAYFKQTEPNQFPPVQILREVDDLNEKFYRDAHTSLQKIHRFWQKIIQKFASELNEEHHSSHSNRNIFLTYSSQIEEQIVRIHRGIRELENTLRKIEALSLAGRQERVLGSIRKLCLQLSDQKEYAGQLTDLSREGDDGETLGFGSRGDFLQYIEIVDEKISKISLKLLTELGYKRLQLIGQTLTFLMPKPYKEDLQSTLKNHHEPVYKFPYLIPIKCSDNSVILKRVTAYLEIDIKCGYSIVLHFYSTYRNRDPFIIYNMDGNAIQAYNRAFLEIYNLDSNKLNSKIHHFLNPDQIFADFDLNDRHIQTKLAESGFETEYNCRMQTSKIGCKKTNILQSVRISLIQKQKYYMILKILRGHRMKSIVDENQDYSISRGQPSGLENALLPNSSSYSNSTQSSHLLLMKSHANIQESSYCKIENPYESKLNNKKLELTKKTGKNSYKCYMVLALVLALLMIFVQGVLFVVVNARVDGLLGAGIKEKLDEAEEYALLMEAYQRYFGMVLAKMERERVVGLQGEQGYNRTLAALHSQIQSQIDNFQQKYLYNLLTPSPNPIPYTLTFTHFTLQTDTSKTNLFDFSQNLLQPTNPESLHFLLQNYPTFGQLILSVDQQVADPRDKVWGILVVYYAGSGVLLLGVIFGLGVAGFFGGIARGVARDVEWIFRVVSWRNLQDMFDELGTTCSHLQENGEQARSEYAKCQKSFKSSMFVLEQQRSRFQIQQSNKPSSPNTPTTQTALKHTETLNEQLLQQYQQTKTCTARLKALPIPQYLFFLLTIVMIALIQTMYFQAKIGNQGQILEFCMENRRISQNVRHQVMEAQYWAILGLGGNGTEMGGLGDRQVFIDKFSINDKKLPVSYFQEYNSLYYQKVLGDLCLMNKDIDTKMLNFNVQTCSEVGGGIFKYGLIKAIEYLGQLLLQPSPSWYSQSPYSPLNRVLQIEYSQQVITNTIKQNEKDFTLYYEKFISKMNDQAIVIFAFGLLLILVLAGAIFKVKRAIYRESQIAIGQFLILPKKALLQSQVLDHIRHNDLLNRISKI